MNPDPARPPIPVAVVLVPVGGGLLVIRRAIQPGHGKLALPGGFIDAHETWQAGAARDLREETGIAIDAASLEPFWYTSSEPDPSHVLLFAISAPPVSVPSFTPNAATSERGIIRGPDGLDEVFAFPLHAKAARRYFASRGVVSGPNAFTAR